MNKKELEFRLQIAEKAINDALQKLSEDNIKSLTDEEKFKEYTMNLACGYAKACGSARYSLENYFDKVKDIEEYGINFMMK